MGCICCKFKSQTFTPLNGEGTNTVKFRSNRNISQLDRYSMFFHNDRESFHFSQAQTLKAEAIKPNLKMKFDVSMDDIARVTGLTTVNYNRLLVCDNRSQRVMVYSITGKFIHTCEMKSHPYDITVLSDTDQAAVSFQGEHFIQFLSIEPSRILATRIMVTKKNCGGISSYDDKIALGGQGVIHIYLISGEHIQSIAISAGQISILKYFDKYTAYSDLFHIYVNGTKISLPNDSKSLSPGGITVDNCNNVYATEHNTDTVYKLSQVTGRAYKILSKEDNLYGPKAMCFSKDFTMLFIANNNGESVFVYSLL